MKKLSGKHLKTLFESGKPLVVNVHWASKHDFDYQPGARTARYLYDDQTGTVVQCSESSHGLCFRVHFASGGEAWYQPEELPVCK